jgi:Antirestriction protein
MNENMIESKIQASLVPEEQRLDILPKFIGIKHMMRFESLVYFWMANLCESYKGGVWHYFTLSNGGFYMSPAETDRIEMGCEGNGFQGILSVDGAGIVAVLFALNQLAAEKGEEKIVVLYDQLRDFADEHQDAIKIFAAID